MATIAASGLISAVAAAEVEARTFELGLTDSVFSSEDPGERTTWLDRAVEVGARNVLPAALWAGIAPAVPSGDFDPTDPADPEYDFSETDAAVRDAHARGLDLTLLVTGAPLWAEGKNRPSDTSKARPGTWKPKPGELKKFAKAVAGRYSGSFDDPGDTAGVLPRVRDFQLWAEPNLATYLTPQFRGKKPVGARHYRRMLRAFYKGVHSVSKRNRVVTGGTAPYGDVPGNKAGRTSPALFWREVLCLRGEKLRKRRCQKPARFDVLAHHPINVGNPQRRALNADDVSTPDIGKLRRILGKAQRSGRALPRKPRKPIWATEIWWDSKPPDPNGVPERKHARWLAQSLYLLWQQRVERVVWFLIRDQARERQLRDRRAVGPLHLRRRAEARPSRLCVPVRRRLQARQGEALGRRAARGKGADRAQGGWRVEALCEPEGEGWVARVRRQDQGTKGRQVACGAG